MWDEQTQTLYYQLDNSQDWDYYGEGDPSSATGDCGGTYSTPYCLITEYDIWDPAPGRDNYKQPGDPSPCYTYTTFFICDRPVYPAVPQVRTSVRIWQAASRPFCPVLSAQSLH